MAIFYYGGIYLLGSYFQNLCGNEILPRMKVPLPGVLEQSGTFLVDLNEKGHLPTTFTTNGIIFGLTQPF